MPMHPRPMTPTSGPLLPSVVVRMLHSRLVSRRLAPGRACLLTAPAGLLAVLLTIRKAAPLGAHSPRFGASCW
jgi:hypothetical protein